MEIITFYAKTKQYIFHFGYNHMEKFDKTPTEIRRIEFEFKDDLPTNEICGGSSSVTATDKTGADVTATLIDGVSVVDDTKIRCKVKAGTLDEDYIITFNAVTDPGQLNIQSKLLLQIRSPKLVTHVGA